MRQSEKTICTDHSPNDEYGVQVNKIDARSTKILHIVLEQFDTFSIISLWISHKSFSKPHVNNFRSPFHLNGIIRIHGPNPIDSPIAPSTPEPPEPINVIEWHVMNDEMAKQ